MENKIKELTDFYMWMVENEFDHNIRVRVEKKSEMYLSKISEHFPKEEEKPKYDFVCPHSGYGFNERDAVWYIFLDEKYSNRIREGIIVESDIDGRNSNMIQFPTKELAIQWSKERFGEKDNKKEALENIEKFVKETPKEEIVERLENNSPKQPIKEEEEYKCKKCGDTGRIEPYSIENPDGEECECSVKQDWKQPFEITYKEGQTTTFGGVKYTLGHGKWIREETQTLEERVTDLQLKYNTIILTLDVIGEQINKFNSLNK